MLWVHGYLTAVECISRCQSWKHKEGWKLGENMISVCLVLAHISQLFKRYAHWPGLHMLSPPPPPVFFLSFLLFNKSHKILKWNHLPFFHFYANPLCRLSRSLCLCRFSARVFTCVLLGLCVHARLEASMFTCVFVWEEDRWRKEERIVCLCVCHYYIGGRSKMLSLKHDESLAEDANEALMGSRP